MRKIIIDTNALMSIGELNLDIFSEISKCMEEKYQLYILSGTIEELNKIFEKQKGKNKAAAKLALSIIKVKKIEIIKVEKNIQEYSVDDELVNLSKKGYLILTQDIGLKNRLNAPYLTIRQKKKVILIK